MTRVISWTVTETALTIGAVLAGYRIERKLGEGGMGAVYLARNPDLPRHDAVKVLSAELSRDPEFRARFIREADVAARLTHPNIVAVYRRGETKDGQLWIAMQFVDGTDADAALRAGTMTPQRAIRIVGEVAAALDYAHRHHVVHRDVKPANFLLARDADEERVLLADFGIARALDEIGLTTSGAIVSTVAYAAPEVLAGTVVDYRADLYSLGCSLFKLLTGKTPFWTATGAPAVMLAHLQQQPPPVTDLAPELPSALNEVIAVAMAKDPALRYRTAGELAAAASAALHGQEHTVRWPVSTNTGVRAPVSPYPLSPGPPDLSRKKSRRRRIVAGLLGAGLVATAAVITFAVAPLRPATAPTTPTTVAVPPVPMRDLPGLLPNADDLGGALGTAVSIGSVDIGMGIDFKGLDTQSCAGPWMMAQRDVYAGSGWQALELQTGKQSAPATAPGGLPLPSVYSFVAVVSFPVAELAPRFFDSQKPAWQRCARRSVTYAASGDMRVPVRFDQFAVTGDNIFTISHQTPNLSMICGHGLTVRNNIAIDVVVCNSAKPVDAAVMLIKQIATKLPR